MCQHQKFHRQVKIYVSIQAPLRLIQGFDDFLDSFIAAALGDTADGTDELLMLEIKENG